MNQPRLWDTSILNMENSPVEAQCGPVYPFLKIYKMYVLTFVLENITLICVLELRFKFLCLVKKICTLYLGTRDCLPKKVANSSHRTIIGIWHDSCHLGRLYAITEHLLGVLPSNQLAADAFPRRWPMKRIWLGPCYRCGKTLASTWPASLSIPLPEDMTVELVWKEAEEEGELAFLTLSVSGFPSLRGTRNLV